MSKTMNANGGGGESEAPVATSSVMDAQMAALVRLRQNAVVGHVSVVAAPLAALPKSSIKTDGLNRSPAISDAEARAVLSDDTSVIDASLQFHINADASRLPMHPTLRRPHLAINEAINRNAKLVLRNCAPELQAEIQKGKYQVFLEKGSLQMSTNTLTPLEIYVSGTRAAKQDPGFGEADGSIKLTVRKTDLYLKQGLIEKEFIDRPMASDQLSFLKKYGLPTKEHLSSTITPYELPMGKGVPSKKMAVVIANHLIHSLYNLEVDAADQPVNPPVAEFQPGVVNMPLEKAEEALKFAIDEYGPTNFPLLDLKKFGLVVTPVAAVDHQGNKLQAAFQADNVELEGVVNLQLRLLKIDN